ncbi:MAG: ATP-dependent DNA helicase RecG [Gammaproteobacteria bacterium]
MSNPGWAQSISELKGIGPALQSKFAGLGIETFKDLLLHLPARYEDRTHLYPLKHLQLGQYAQIEAEIVDSSVRKGKRKQLTLTVMEGQTAFKIQFYHYYPNQEKAYAIAARIRCYGQVTRIGRFLGMIHPDIELVRSGKPLADFLTAVYPTVKGISQKLWRQCMQAVFKFLEQLSPMEEGLPDNLLKAKSWPRLIECLQFLHQPPPMVTLARIEAGTLPAIERLVCEELLAHQLSWRQYRKHVEKLTSPSFSIKESLFNEFISSLAFELTNAQKKVIAEIRRDLAKPQAMMRLLQGDVGSGKTVVAAISALTAMSSGYKVACMAPTALLVEQHWSNFKRWFQDLGYPVLKLTSMTTTRERKQIHQALMQNEPLVLIGTQALIQPEVEINGLGLVIMDEQHRFGVHQRLKLCEKNTVYPPHQLIMTATPIPRTLVMTYYADLEVSVLDEMPKGRQPVVTVVLPNEKRQAVIQRIRSVIKAGQQVYWVCPLIDESESLEAQAATGLWEILKSELPDIQVGLIHGKLAATDKEEQMACFRQGKTQLLVATTVIEVGVDVPNATLMIIENAERLGLAQVHQLRGRVGRGAKQSYCVLLYDGGLSSIARERLGVLRDSVNGFEIAEKDLALRGPGEILGTRQAGGRQFKVADLSRDREKLKEMAELAPQFWVEYPAESQVLISRWCERKMPFGKV